MVHRTPSLARTLLTGVGAGLLAGVAVAAVDRVTERLVSEEQKRREKEVREDSAHKLAGPHFARKILGREPTETEKRRSRMIFGVAFGVMWGIIHAAARRNIPAAGKFGGLPFAVPFFLACDGGMAPLLGISPGIQKLPWQINAKEMGNHIAWTLAADTIHRLAAHASGRSREPGH